MSPEHTIPLGRRAFLQGGTLTLLAAGIELAVPRSLFATGNGAAPLRFGVVTDLHYADKPHAGSRVYRETPAKLAEAIERFSQHELAFTVELGDFIDSAPDVKTEKRWLSTIQKQFAAIPGAKHYVLGNHCVDTLTKDEFLGGVGQTRSFYSFDAGGTHFVVLDACFRSDGAPYGRKNSHWDDANIPAEELDWLRADLAATRHAAIVLAHQRLDGSDRHCVKNAADVRGVLEESRRVEAVFQGHSHKNDYKRLGDIHYVTLVAMVEGAGAKNSGYSIVERTDDGTLQVNGFRQQVDYDWTL